MNSECCLTAGKEHALRRQECNTHTIWKHTSHHFYLSLIASFLGMFLQSQNHPSSKGHAEAQTFAQLYFYCVVLPYSLSFISCALCNPLFLICHQNYCSYSPITEQPGLGETLKLILFQPPCHEQGHFSPNLASQGPSQPGLKHCQTWGIYSFSGNPVPMSHYLHSKEFLPHI